MTFTSEKDYQKHLKHIQRRPTKRSMMDRIADAMTYRIEWDLPRFGAIDPEWFIMMGI